MRREDLATGAHLLTQFLELERYSFKRNKKAGQKYCLSLRPPGTGWLT